MTVRELALSMLDSYELEGKYVNLLLSSHRADSLTREERASLTALLYTVTEHKLTYDYYISSVAKRDKTKIDIHTLNILRLGVCQIADMNSIPDFAAVNESVKLARGKGERAFVNAVLRKIASLKENGELPLPDRAKSPARYLSVYYSFPLWITKHFISLLGESGAESLLARYNRHDTTDLTVNLTKISRDGYLALLRDLGYKADPSGISRLTVRIFGACDPKRLPGFEEGFFFVQDTASAFATLALMPETGDKIVDVCACPGGKSFASAVLTENRAEILSLDLHESKLSLVSSGAQRLGFSSITVGAADARIGKEELFGKFDRLICDAPCSGLGVLGKKPDIRYRDEGGLDELPALQYEILASSSRYLRPGGEMIYSTCTLNPAENEEIVRRFLDTHHDFSSVEFEVGGLTSTDGMITLYPHMNETDGFFVAKLRKSY